MRPRLRALIAAVILLAGGCPLAAAPVLVLTDLLASSPDADQAFIRALTNDGLEVQTLASDNLTAQLASHADGGSILVLANATAFPADAVPALQAFLRRGNHLIAQSGPPFQRLLARKDGNWVDSPAGESPPLFESISPRYKLHLTAATRLTSAKDAAPFAFHGSVLGSLPRAPGFGGDVLRKWRQIPLAHAQDDAGTDRAIAAQLFLNHSGDYAGSAWGYVGIQPEDRERTRPWATSLIIAMVHRLQAGLFLANAGVNQFAVVQGDPLSLGAFVTNLSQNAADVEVRFRVNEGPRVVHESVLPLHCAAARSDPPARVAGAKLELPPGEYTVTTTLVRDGREIDAITQPFRVIAATPPNADEIVSVHDGDFHLAGKTWRPIGVNYWPRYIAGVEPADFSNAEWDPAQYNPQIVEEDLTLAESLGLKLLSIQFSQPAHAGPVMDLLARAQRHGLKVNVYLPGLHPLEQDLPRAGAVIRAAHLADNAAVFAYDLGWEVRVGTRTARVPWDRAWHRWVLDQYGSLAAATADWKFVPPSDHGVLTGATDEQLKQDGPWRGYVAAYRRFWDDMISRGYREVRTYLHSLDPHHLIGARSGYGGTGAEWIAEHLPFDLASGAKHLDFISPEHYETPATQQDFLRGAFTTAYARLVSGGKPVYWAEYGRPVAWMMPAPAYPLKPDAAALRTQADYFRDVGWMVHEARANGSAGWWWPAGYRVDERSDFGLVNPDRTLRPAAQELARVAQAFAERRPELPREGEMLLDRDPHVTGYAGVYRDLADRYAAQHAAGHPPTLRTAGTGTDSASVPLVAVGNVPGNGHNPLKFLNAEFNSVRVNGRLVHDGDIVAIDPAQPVRIDVSAGNTAEARWLARTGHVAGAVYLAARWENQEVLRSLEADTGFLHDAVIPSFVLRPHLDKPVSLALRMTALGRADFGEIVRVTLQRARPDGATAPPR